MSTAASFAQNPPIRIIPCLDVKEGRVVKGVRFIDLVDAGDPVEQARLYDRAGADELVFLDITASYEKRSIMLDVVERTASEVFLPLTVGGGIRTVEDFRTLLLAGADKVSINSAAVKQPELVKQAATRFGGQCVTVAIDARRTNSLKKIPSGFEVLINGGRTETGLDAADWAHQVQELGAGEILLTSMDQDGVQSGYDLDLLRCVARRVSIPVIASGGAGTLAHLVDGVKEGYASAVLAASIFHFGKFSIAEAKNAFQQAGIAVRPPNPL